MIQLKRLLILGGLMMLPMVAQVSQAADVEKTRQEIIKIMKVTPDRITNASAEVYQDNLNSVRENQNKIQVNAATRAIALGQRAVALSTQSGADIEKMRKDIEETDDMMQLLKNLARLQAQSLQKINEITALRAKMLELNSIENIVSGDVMTTDEDAIKAAGGAK